jgi:acyl transferase domain-containing protein
VEQFWQNLVGGVESISRADPHQARAQDGEFVSAVGRLTDTDTFDAEYFRVPAAEAVAMDPQHRLLLEVSVEALDDAGYGDARDLTVGVFAGCGENLYRRKILDRGAATDDLRLLLANEKDFLAPRVAFKLGLTGPAITIQASCSTSLAAVGLACQSLLIGDCDMAIAGGISLLLPDDVGYAYEAGGVCSADGRCRTFDESASGTLPASGVGMVVLKLDDRADAEGDNRRGIIRGWAMNNDGGSRAGFTVPNIAGQEAVIRAALRRAGTDPDDISYIEAHGTGTPIGDPVEVEALTRVFGTGTRTSPCAIGSVKPSIGHTDAAAGVANLIKATLAVERGVIPASLHFETPNPAIDFGSGTFAVASETTSWVPVSGRRLAGVSAFGLGGVNAHVIVENADRSRSPQSQRLRQPLVLSARTPADLEQMRTRLADWFAANPGLSAGELGDVAFTLAVGRRTFASRWSGVVTSSEDAERLLRADEESARSTTRWSLLVRGTPEELAAMGGFDEPVLGDHLASITDEVSRLGGDETPSTDSPTVVGALKALAVVRALDDVGLSFARVDGPAWLRPVMDWHQHGGAPNDMLAALASCDAGAGTAVRAAAFGSVVVDRDFDLVTALATVWRHGGTPNWGPLFVASHHRRTSLPTYPFNRQRFWPERVTPDDPPARETTSRQPATNGDVADVVEEVWRENLGRDELPRDAHFVHDLDGDSMLGVGIGSMLRQQYPSIEVPIDLPFLAPTVNSSAAYIEQALAGAASR